MRKTKLLAFVIVHSLFVFSPAATAQSSPQELGSWWDKNHVELPLPPLITHRDVDARVKRIAASDPSFFKIEQLGTSVEGRAIQHLWFGHGPTPILLWSQMHGDEPTATSALFSMIAYFHMGKDRPEVKRILDALTIHLVPMLNPDGAERFTRRNAQGIDVNRDALMLQTPEGRMLKELRDRINPVLGFNLHNQNWRTSVGNTGKPASISLLAVAFDEPRSDNPGRLRAKKVAGIIRDVVETFAPGQVAKYDDEFEPRAFGDNLTKWGTPIVLIETGAYPGPQPDTALVRINFAGILTALDALATGEADKADPVRYESLPYNGSSVLYEIVSRVNVVIGDGVPAFKADIGITATPTVKGSDRERSEVVLVKRIEEFGDLSTFGALEMIDGEGLTAAPIWDPVMKVGDLVSLPDFSKAKASAVIAPATSANFVLLKSNGAGRYRVERLFRPEETMK